MCLTWKSHPNSAGPRLTATITAGVGTDRVIMLDRCVGRAEAVRMPRSYGTFYILYDFSFLPQSSFPSSISIFPSEKDATLVTRDRVLYFLVELSLVSAICLTSRVIRHIYLCTYRDVVAIAPFNWSYTMARPLSSTHG